jgi:hypothetical protein
LDKCLYRERTFRSRPRETKEAGMAQTPDRNRTKYVLDEKDIPTKWYNIQADLKTPAPPVLHPGTGKPIGPQDLAPLFPMALIKQEVGRERWVEIPEEVRNVYRLWRPSPLFRARRLEKALGTPALKGLPQPLRAAVCRRVDQDGAGVGPAPGARGPL